MYGFSGSGTKSFKEQKLEATDATSMFTVFGFCEWQTKEEVLIGKKYFPTCYCFGLQGVGIQEVTWLMGNGS